MGKLKRCSESGQNVSFLAINGLFWALFHRCVFFREAFCIFSVSKFFLEYLIYFLSYAYDRRGVVFGREIEKFITSQS